MQAPLEVVLLIHGAPDGFCEMPVVVFHVIAVEFLRILPGGTLIVHPVRQLFGGWRAFYPCCSPGCGIGI